MRNLYVVGNWKMHGNRQSLNTLILALCDRFSNFPHSLEVGVCPPFVYLESINQALSRLNSKIKLGAQDSSCYQEGAYTGQISAAMLADLGCNQVIVGHSERRHGCFEDPETVAKKAQSVFDHGLQPIVCIGETLEEREQNRTKDVLEEQLKPILALGESVLKKVILAYEPVWAIGTGKTATPDQAQEIHAWIRSEVAKEVKVVAQSLPILYGGSVKPNNALELFQCPDIDGGLIGGASLDADAFFEICESAIKVS